MIWNPLEILSNSRVSERVLENSPDIIMVPVDEGWKIRIGSLKLIGIYTFDEAKTALNLIEGKVRMISALNTNSAKVVRYYCYCRECGSYFYSNRRCDLTLCPKCKDSNRDNIEIIGEHS